MSDNTIGVCQRVAVLWGVGGGCVVSFLGVAFRSVVVICFEVHDVDQVDNSRHVEVNWENKTLITF